MIHNRYLIFQTPFDYYAARNLSIRDVAWDDVGGELDCELTNIKLVTRRLLHLKLRLAANAAIRRNSNSNRTHLLRAPRTTHHVPRTAHLHFVGTKACTYFVRHLTVKMRHLETTARYCLRLNAYSTINSFRYIEN